MQLIAHRGLSALAPENTLAAVRLALKRGASAVEVDAHRTRDGRLVVIHDDDLRRVAGRRRRIADMDWAELAAADVGAWFGRRFSGERVPLLEEVLELTRGRAELHLELKHGSAVYPGIEESAVRLLRRHPRAKVVVSSFDHKALFEVRRLASGLRLGYLLGRTFLRTAFREAAELGAESLNLSRRQVGARRVSAAHARGLKVLVYTVDSPEELRRLEDMGVDGVYTNGPAVRLPR